MNLYELVKFFRISILEDTGGIGIDWTTIAETDNESILVRWTNEELVGFINHAIDLVYRRILPVQKYEPAFNIAVQAGKSEYLLDRRIIDVIGVRLDILKYNLKPWDHQDAIESDDIWDEREGNPTQYLIDYGTGIIRLWRRPIANDTLKLLVNRFPLNKLDWANYDETPELRNEYHIPMLYYAAHLAYLKDNPNTLDPQRALTYLTLFNKEFPETSAYSDTRKRRTNNRTVQYGGIT